MNVTVMLTCYNRKDKTIKCIKSLVDGNKDIEFKFIVVDDNSTDGTKEELTNLNYDINIVGGSGNLYWNGGMYLAIDTAMKSYFKSDYYLLVNDDVEFGKNSIKNLINDNDNIEVNSVVVGATCDDNGNLSYGGIKFNKKSKLSYKTIEPNKNIQKCDTFNANCVLIPRNVFFNIGNLDSFYKHGMGDFDYGYKIRNKGYNIFSSTFYVGKCNKNSIKGTWNDKELGIIERIKLKESVKGLPSKQWFYYLKKNYGYCTALIHSISPFIKIIKTSTFR